MSRRESAPGWVWMLFGLSIGLIVALGVYLRVPPTGETATRTAAAPTPRAAPPRQGSAAPAEENRFEFYEILPQLEVVVPESDEPATQRAQRPSPTAAPGSYLIQAGSFSAAADADRLKASLALLGFESHVQPVLIDGARFNRVRIGPIDDVDAAKRAQRSLRDAGIDSLLMQVPR